MAHTLKDPLGHAHHCGAQRSQVWISLWLL